MKLEATLVLLRCFLAACSALSSRLFTGLMPHPSGARLILPAARVAEMLRGRDFRNAGGAPYWDPSLEQFEICEVALWRRARWSMLHDEIGDYIIQVFGVTNLDRPMIVMLGVCPAEGDLAGAGRMIGGFHSRCSICAVCDPESQEPVQFYGR